MPDILIDHADGDVILMRPRQVCLQLVAVVPDRDTYIRRRPASLRDPGNTGRFRRVRPYTVIHPALLKPPSYRRH